MNGNADYNCTYYPKPGGPDYNTSSFVDWAYSDGTMHYVIGNHEIGNLMGQRKFCTGEPWDGIGSRVVEYVTCTACLMKLADEAIRELANA
jgi:hypothetical protein